MWAVSYCHLEEIFACSNPKILLFYVFQRFYIYTKDLYLGQRSILSVFFNITRGMGHIFTDGYHPTVIPLCGSQHHTTLTFLLYNKSYDSISLPILSFLKVVLAILRPVHTLKSVRQCIQKRFLDPLRGLPSNKRSTCG